MCARVNLHIDLHIELLYHLLPVCLCRILGGVLKLCYFITPQNPVKIH